MAEVTSLQSSTSSSLAPTTPASSIQHMPTDHTRPALYRKYRPSFSSLQRLPKDLSALIGSHSSLRRNNSLSQAKAVLADYAGQQTSKKNKPLDMLNPDEPDRRSRSRIYNLFSRSPSRSRSHSRQRSSSFEDHPFPSTDRPPLPNGPSHARHSSVPSESHPQSSPRPPSRLPSRPLSSTTTATHSTITPLTPIPTSRDRGRRKYSNRVRTNSIEPEVSVPGHAHALHNDLVDLPYGSKSMPSSRSNTPKGSTRMKLHSLFGISISKSKKQDDSPPVTPNELGLDGVDTAQIDVDASPITQNGTLQTASSGSTSLSSRARSPSLRRREKDKGRGRSFIPRLFSGSSHKARSKEREQFSHNQAFKPSSPSDLLVADPFASPLSAQHADPVIPSHQNQVMSTPQASSSRSSLPSSLLSKINPPQPRPAISIPKINRIPPTPYKTRPTTAGEDRDQGVLRPRDGQGHRRNGSGGRWSPRFFGAKKEGEKEGHLDVDKAVEVGSSVPRSVYGDGNSAAVTAKHASFDFEKPSWRTGGDVERARSVVKPRDRGQKASSSLLTENRPATHDRSMGPPAVPIKQYQPRATGPIKSHHSGASVSSNTPSQSTTNTNNRSALSSLSGSVVGPSVASSSLGRNVSSKKVSRVNVSNAYTHPSFAFEPPAHSRVLSDKLSQSHNSLSKGRNGSRSVEGSNAGSYRIPGQRRSLDLGLGLAWAPTKVKPEAVLHGGFARSFSAREGQTGRDAKSKVPAGSSVTETFRRVLPENGFIAFKKYVRRFDAKTIPFDGPTGIVTRVETLLDSAPGMSARERQDLMDSFIRLILENA